MEHNCVDRHVPERAFNYTENTDAVLIRMQKYQIINITIEKSWILAIHYTQLNSTKYSKLQLNKVQLSN